MSVIFVQTPEPFQPVLSDGLYFTVSSNTYDAQSTFKFRYVYELYVDDQLVFEGKCSPNPYGLGIIDLQQVLESYTNSLPISYFNTTPIYTHTTFPFSVPANDETILFDVKVGYEYASTELGQITGFTGIGDTVGVPSYPSFKYKTFRSTMGTNPRATQQDFNIGPFVLSGTPLGTWPTTTGLFLTNAPRIQNIGENEYYTLGFTNYYMNSGSTPTILSEPYYVEYNFYDDQGTLLDTQRYDNIISNGGGPRTNGCDVYQALYLLNPYTETNYNTLYVGAGPANFMSGSTSLIPVGTKQYTVQLFGLFEGETTPIQPTPTPTPSNTPGATTPTPTPTPSATPPCSGCTSYDLLYTGGNASTVVSIVNCITGAAQSVLIYQNVLYNVCSCSSPFADPEVVITDLGPCNPNPTPTPTPSSTPPGCVCVEYFAENTNDYTSFVQYIDCSGTPQTEIIPGFFSTTFCACEGSVEPEAGIDVSVLGPCVTPTPTTTPTRTPTPTPSSGVYDYYYLVRDCDDPLTTRCFASNSVFVPGKVVKSATIVGCWEIEDFCSAPHDAVITLSYDDCPSCPR